MREDNSQLKHGANYLIFMEEQQSFNALCMIIPAFVDVLSNDSAMMSFTCNNIKVQNELMEGTHTSLP